MYYKKTHFTLILERKKPTEKNLVSDQTWAKAAAKGRHAAQAGTAPAVSDRQDRPDRVTGPSWCHAGREAAPAG